MAEQGVPAPSGMQRVNSYTPANDNVEGGGTLAGTSTLPTMRDYENIFGPAARDIKSDPQRNRRHARWHLPDALKGANPWLTDRIDGLITDMNESPFTTVILPYKYIENVDQKLKWNVWSFDEGLASRVPYESAARTLTQTKRSYAGYTIRQGLAITMEHNFMMSEKGRENFKNQVSQMVQSIQHSNNIDVQMALLQAPSYARTVAEKYYTSGKTQHQLIREYIDIFGFMAKNPNAMDIIIEEARQTMRTWGAKEPNFLLTNPKLTFQMTMTPEKTQYLTQGYDGIKRLRTGPNIHSYRGLRIIPTQSFSMENGAPPRDILSRRVRVAEYYVFDRPTDADMENTTFELYDESKDGFESFKWDQLVEMAKLATDGDTMPENGEYRFMPVRADRGEQFTQWRQNQNDRGLLGDAAYSHENLVSFQVTAEDPLQNIILQEVHHPTRYYRLAKTGGELDNVERNDIIERIRHPDSPGSYIRVTNGLLHNPGELTPTSDSAKIRAELLALFGGREIDYPDDLVFVLQPRELPYVENIQAVTIYNAGGYYVGSRVHPSKPFDWKKGKRLTGADGRVQQIVILRPCIEHNMLGVVMGCGGLEDLGATLWGQTELSCYDDSMHGIWGMSYKYNEKAIVFNEKNLTRVWDIAYDGYNGGKDTSALDWQDESDVQHFCNSCADLSKPYEGPSMLVMSFQKKFGRKFPSPIVLHGDRASAVPVYLDGENVNVVNTEQMFVFDDNSHGGENKARFNQYMHMLPDFSLLHQQKMAGQYAAENETSYVTLAFQGTSNVKHNEALVKTMVGNGHHGCDYVGAASVRAGKGIRSLPQMGMRNVHVL